MSYLSDSLNGDRPLHETPERRKAGWSHFPHDADIGVRGTGPDCATAFEQAALALTAVVTDPDRVKPVERIGISCEAADRELLLYDWLNAVLFEMATRQMLFSRFQVALNEHVLTGAAWGEEIDRARHRPAAEIKGATYTCLEVSQRADGRWVAQCVVDT